ncbi:MAG: aldehyde dehydrogenase [Sphingobium sp.]
MTSTPVLTAEQTSTIDPPRLAHADRLYIGGDWVIPEAGGSIRIVSPITGEIFASVAEAGPADVDRAVTAARRAFDEGPWPRMSGPERAAIIRAVADALRRRVDEAARAWTTQIGTPLWISEGATAHTIGILDYYAGIVETMVLEDVRETQALGFSHAIVVREPVGVVAAVAPWNAPLAAMLQKVGPALAAGCTVVAKPAPESPIEAFLLAEACEEAGLPAGVFNLAPADRAASDHLISHADVDKVSFTGSTIVGRHIAEVCGGRLARATMELGGKSAAILLDDMDPAMAAQILAPTISMMCGQVCANLSRILVPRARAREYTEALAAGMAGVPFGDPFQAGVLMGPLAMERQRDRVEGYIAKGKEQGAKIATGGGRPSALPRGFYFEPTIFADVTNDMTIAREEIFGPVAGVIAYDSEEEAIRIANDSPFGLSGAVFTNDTDRAYGIMRRLRTGNLSQNGRGLDVQIPFGGFKQSGYGREGGKEGIEPYLEIKSIFVPKLPSHLA